MLGANRGAAGSTMHSVDNHESPIRPASSGSHRDDGGVAVAPTPHTLPCSVLLHLGPGLVVGAAYLALIPAARALGLPSAAAIGAQAILVTGPLMIGILMVSRRRRPGEPTIALRRVPTVAATLGWAAVIICAAAAAFVLTRRGDHGVRHPTGLTSGSAQKHPRRRANPARIITVRIAVIGGSGLVGSFLVPRLVRAGTRWST